MSTFWSILCFTWTHNVWDYSIPLKGAVLKMITGFLVLICFYLALIAGITLQSNKLIFWMTFTIALGIFFTILKVAYNVNSVLVGLPFLMVFILSFYIWLALFLGDLAGKYVLPFGNPYWDWKKIKLKLS
ncbi:hypothetical protein M0811_07643 [Anaeramoeba ignava]|nr:hypothetical protein M0811_07643 [Anaeramoeba ignava]|eukprot:Anaeramoba_ignava/a358256_7.p1 GENE.a358256_7~~a358256_7.p1  ORF type:complete len:130 (-),score=26.83 a358256_7:182-571(-)